MPAITINSRFENAIVKPLFGVPVTAWQREDTTALQGWLTACRTEAMRNKDNTAGNALYAMLKELRTTYKALRGVWSAEKGAEGVVDRLTREKPSEELGAVMDIAIAALEGEDVTGRSQELPGPWVGYGRQAEQLAQFAPMLTAASKASFIEQLRSSKVSVAADVAARDAEQEALLARIAAVPLDASGAAQLRAIAQGVDVSTMSREEYDAYNGALQYKQQAINRQLEAAQAAAESERRSLPAPVVERVDALLVGEDVDDLALSIFALNQPRQEIARAAENTWGFKQTPSLELDETHFAVTRRTMSELLESERRSGGLLIARSYRGRAGKLRYREHYPGPVPLAELETHLKTRFGAPDTREVAAGGRSITLLWKDGDRYLQAQAGNRIDQHLQLEGVQSSMELALWSADFTAYLAAAQERCERLADKPRDELSNTEAVALGMGCLEP